MTIRRRRKSVWEYVCKCERCGHSWTSLGKAAPKRCASCKAPGFNRPARWTRPKK